MLVTTLLLYKHKGSFLLIIRALSLTAQLHSIKTAPDNPPPQLRLDQGKGESLPTHSPMSRHSYPTSVSVCSLPTFRIQPFQNQPYWEGGCWFVVLGLTAERRRRYFLLQGHIKQEKRKRINILVCHKRPGVFSNALRQGSSNLAVSWNLLEALKYPDAHLYLSLWGWNWGISIFFFFF